MSASVTRHRPMSSQEFAILGGSRMAYVRPARSEDVAFMCEDAPMLKPGQQVYVLHAADGTPILITDSLEAAIANAETEQLQTVSLH